jgi:hypothetical protein
MVLNIFLHLNNLLLGFSMARFLDLKVLKEYFIVGLVSFNCEIELKFSFLFGFVHLELNSADFI